MELMVNHVYKKDCDTGLTCDFVKNVCREPKYYCLMVFLMIEVMIH